jgi:hypothetical protein
MNTRPFGFITRANSVRSRTGAGRTGRARNGKGPMRTSGMNRRRSPTWYFELVMTAASRPDIVQKMIITSDSAYITKGPATDLEGFDISTSYLNRENRLRKRDQDGVAELRDALGFRRGN